MSIFIENSIEGGGLAFYKSNDFLDRELRTYNDNLGVWQNAKRFLPTFQLWSEYNISKIEVWAMRTNNETKLFDFINTEGWIQKFDSESGKWIVTATEQETIRGSFQNINFDFTAPSLNQLRLLDVNGIVRYYSQIYKPIEYECE